MKTYKIIDYQIDNEYTIIRYKTKNKCIAYIIYYFYLFTNTCYNVNIKLIQE